MEHTILHKLYMLAQDIKPVGKSRIVAAIYYKKKLISMGFCKYKTHPLQAKFGEQYYAIQIHAEINAIVNTPKTTDLTKCNIYIARAKKHSITRHWQWGLAKPCMKGCTQAINEYGLKRVIYTTNQTGVWQEW